MSLFSLEKIKADYEKGLITKPEYIKKMYLIHRHLFAYADFLKKTDIGKIEISDDRVLMTSRENGINLICSPGDQRVTPIEILNFNNYENEEMEMILSLMEKDFTFFDVGANLGWYTIKIAKSIKGARIFSFEPMPKTFALLKENLKINNIKNAQIFNLGLANENKKAKFYFHDECLANASLKNVSRKTKAKKISVQVKKLDDFVKKNDLKIDLIKCDVEGAELFVFKGGFVTIRDCKPIIAVEMLRKWAVGFGYNPNETIQFLKEIGYQCFTFKKKKLKEFRKMNEQTKETNFIFLHKEKHQKQIKKLT